MIRHLFYSNRYFTEVSHLDGESEDPNALGLHEVHKYTPKRQEFNDKRSKSLTRVADNYNKDIKLQNKADKLDEKVKDRTDKAKFTKTGKLKRTLNSTKVNPFQYYRSRFRENFGKEGFTNAYDFKSQKISDKAGAMRDKGSYLKGKADQWNEHRKNAGYQYIDLNKRVTGNKSNHLDNENFDYEEPVKDELQSEAEHQRPLTANEKAMRDMNSRG